MTNAQIVLVFVRAFLVYVAVAVPIAAFLVKFARHLTIHELHVLVRVPGIIAAAIYLAFALSKG